MIMMGVSPSPHHIFLMEWESRQLDSTVSRFLFRALKKLNLTGQNGGRFLSFELHLTLYGDRLLNGFVCQKRSRHLELKWTFQ